uniref:Uncharacterized protein n=1 Tax=Anguilla anguilla TaxID=7936 RepID=A0A0E9QKX3_ANGAN
MLNFSCCRFHMSKDKNTRNDITQCHYSNGISYRYSTFVYVNFFYYYGIS